MDAFGNWLAGGYFGKRQLRAWFGELEPQLAEVDVDGVRAFVLAEDLDELASTSATDAVRLLPGFDQYVLGPGTGDGRDGVVTCDEWKAYAAELFDSADANRDNSLDRTEYSKLISTDRMFRRSSSATTTPTATAKSSAPSSSTSRTAPSRCSTRTTSAS